MAAPGAWQPPAAAPTPAPPRGAVRVVRRDHGHAPGPDPAGQALPRRTCLAAAALHAPDPGLPGLHRRPRGAPHPLPLRRGHRVRAAQPLPRLGAAVHAAPGLHRPARLQHRLQLRRLHARQGHQARRPLQRARPLPPLPRARRCPARWPGRPRSCLRCRPTRGRRRPRPRRCPRAARSPSPRTPSPTTATAGTAAPASRRACTTAASAAPASSTWTTTAPSS
jgi:hypothetical protein